MQVLASAELIGLYIFRFKKMGNAFGIPQSLCPLLVAVLPGFKTVKLASGYISTSPVYNISVVPERNTLLPSYFTLSLPPRTSTVMFSFILQ